MPVAVGAVWYGHGGHPGFLKNALRLHCCRLLCQVQPHHRGMLCICMHFLCVNLRLLLCGILIRLARYNAIPQKPLQVLIPCVLPTWTFKAHNRCFFCLLFLLFVLFLKFESRLGVSSAKHDAAVPSSIHSVGLPSSPGYFL